MQGQAVTQATAQQQTPAAGPATPFPAAASYVVLRDGDEAVGVNGTTGSEEFRDVDHGSVIQAVFDAAPDGGSVHFQGPRFEIRTEIAVRVDGLTITGHKTVLSFRDHEPVDFGGEDPPKQRDLYISSEEPIDHLRLEGLIFQSNKEERSNGTVTLDLGNAERTEVVDCTIYGGKAMESDWGYGIVSGQERDEHFIIDNCFFSGADRHAIHNGGRITNCTFERNALVPRSGGVIGTSGFEKTIVSDCTFVDNQGEAVRMNGGETLVVTDNLFIDNANPTTQTGQVTVGKGDFETVRISGNTFTLTESGGEEPYVNISVVRDTTAGSVMITDNHIEGGTLGIKVDSHSPDGAVERLVISGNVVADAESLAFVNSAQQAVVRENVFQNGQRIGLEDIGRGVFADNTIFDAEFYTDASVVTHDNDSL